MNTEEFALLHARMTPLATDLLRYLSQGQRSKEDILAHYPDYTPEQITEALTLLRELGMVT